jgi:hypothetical protein
MITVYKVHKMRHLYHLIALLLEKPQAGSHDIGIVHDASMNMLLGTFHSSWAKMIYNKSHKTSA